MQRHAELLLHILQFAGDVVQLLLAIGYSSLIGEDDDLEIGRNGEGDWRA